MTEFGITVEEFNEAAESAYDKNGKNPPKNFEKIPELGYFSDPKTGLEIQRLYHPRTNQIVLAISGTTPPSNNIWGFLTDVCDYPSTGAKQFSSIPILAEKTIEYARRNNISNIIMDDHSLGVFVGQQAQNQYGFDHVMHNGGAIFESSKFQATDSPRLFDLPEYNNTDKIFDSLDISSVQSIYSQSIIPYKNNPRSILIITHPEPVSYLLGFPSADTVIFAEQADGKGNFFSNHSLSPEKQKKYRMVYSDGYYYSLDGKYYSAGAKNYFPNNSSELGSLHDLSIEEKRDFVWPQKDYLKISNNFNQWNKDGEAVIIPSSIDFGQFTIDLQGKAKDSIDYLPKLRSRIDSRQNTQISLSVDNGGLFGTENLSKGSVSFYLTDNSGKESTYVLPVSEEDQYDRTLPYAEEMRKELTYIPIRYEDGSYAYENAATRKRYKEAPAGSYISSKEAQKKSFYDNYYKESEAIEAEKQRQAFEIQKAAVANAAQSGNVTIHEKTPELTIVESKTGSSQMIHKGNSIPLSEDQLYAHNTSLSVIEDAKNIQKVLENLGKWLW